MLQFSPSKFGRFYKMVLVLSYIYKNLIKPYNPFTPLLNNPTHIIYTPTQSIRPSPNPTQYLNSKHTVIPVTPYLSPFPSHTATSIASPALSQLVHHLTSFLLHSPPSTSLIPDKQKPNTQTINILWSILARKGNFND